jgi:hypothetical protein
MLHVGNDVTDASNRVMKRTKNVHDAEKQFQKEKTLC